MATIRTLMFAGVALAALFCRSLAPAEAQAVRCPPHAPLQLVPLQQSGCTPAAKSTANKSGINKAAKSSVKSTAAAKTTAKIAPKVAPKTSAGKAARVAGKAPARSTVRSTVQAATRSATPATPTPATPARTGPGANDGSRGVTFMASVSTLPWGRGQPMQTIRYGSDAAESTVMAAAEAWLVGNDGSAVDRVSQQAYATAPPVNATVVADAGEINEIDLALGAVMPPLFDPSFLNSLLALLGGAAAAFAAAAAAAAMARYRLA